MKKLICEKDILDLVAAGEKTLYAGNGTLVTPLAKDVARNNGVEIVYGEAPQPAVQPSAPAAVPSQGQATPDAIDSELIYKVLQMASDKGVLADFLTKFSSILAPKGAPYSSERDASGLKVVCGDSIRMDEFFEGNPRVKYQEVIDKNDSTISSGILTIDHDTYEWTQNYDENDYVIEGTFVVTINGRRYTANAGDCVFIPKGATVVMGSKEHCCKVFYNTYPSNWADLMA